VGACAAAQDVKNRTWSRETVAAIDSEEGSLLTTAFEVEVVRLGRETRVVRVVFTRDFVGGFVVGFFVS